MICRYEFEKEELSVIKSIGILMKERFESQRNEKEVKKEIQRIYATNNTAIWLANHSAYLKEYKKYQLLIFPEKYDIYFTMFIKSIDYYIDLVYEKINTEEYKEDEWPIRAEIANNLIYHNEVGGYNPKSFIYRKDDKQLLFSNSIEKIKDFKYITDVMR